MDDLLPAIEVETTETPQFAFLDWRLLLLDILLDDADGRTPHEEAKTTPIWSVRSMF